MASEAQVIGCYDVRFSVGGRSGVYIVWIEPRIPKSAVFKAERVKYVVVYVWKNDRPRQRVIFASSVDELNQILSALRERDDRRARIYVYEMRPLCKWVCVAPKHRGESSQWVKKPFVIHNYKTYLKNPVGAPSECAVNPPLTAHYQVEKEVGI